GIRPRLADVPRPVPDAQRFPGGGGGAGRRPRGHVPRLRRPILTLENAMPDNEFLTIDELARAAGTTVRNVRVYQDRGLLPPPERRGRLGLYGPDHLRRLRLVLRMLGRGYPLAALRELGGGGEGQRDIGSGLGLGGGVTPPCPEE